MRKHMSPVRVFLYRMSIFTRECSNDLERSKNDTEIVYRNIGKSEVRLIEPEHSLCESEDEARDHDDPEEFSRGMKVFAYD